MNNYGYWSDPLFIERMAIVLNKNGLVAGTSDTVVGLLAPLTAVGKSKLDAIKIREHKPYLVLVSSIEKAAKFSDSFIDPIVQKLVKNYWPGPLTLVVPALKNTPAYFCSADGTIALRVPDHAGLQQLLCACGGLFSTSANLSGNPVPSSIADIDPIIKEQVDLLVDDLQSKHAAPSTIVAYRDGVLTVLRSGSIQFSDIR